MKKLCFTVQLSQRLGNTTTYVDCRFELDASTDSIGGFSCHVSFLLLERHQLLECIEALHFFAFEAVQLRPNLVTHEVEVLRNVATLKRH